MCEGLAIIVRRRHDLMEVRSRLKAAECIYQTGFDWVFSRSSTVTPSLDTPIRLGSLESGEERLQYWGEFWISLSLNTQKYWNSSFK